MPLSVMKWPRFLAPLGVILLAVPVFFLPTKERTVSSILEERVAITSREMWRKGEWIVPTMNGQLRLQKPPLAYWLVHAYAVLRGSFDDDTLRHPFAVLGVGAALFAWATARRLFGPRAALLAAASLITMALFVKEGRTATADSAQLFCALGAWHFYLCSRQALEPSSPPGSRRSGWNQLGFYAFLGLGALAKGPVILLLCIVPPLLEAAVTRSLDPLRPLAYPPGIACFLLLALFWPAAVILRLSAESSPVDACRLWWLESMGKVLPSSGVEGGYKYQRHSHEWHFYLPRLFSAFGVWTPALLSALVLGFKRNMAHRLPWVLFVVIFISFSLVTEKKQAYLLPLLGPGSLLVGWFIDAWYPRFQPRLRPVAWALCGFGAVLFGLCVCLALAPQALDGIVERLCGEEGLQVLCTFAVKPIYLVLLGLVAFLGSLGFALGLRRPGPLPAFLALSAALSLGTWFYNELKADLPIEEGDMRVASRVAASLLDPQASVFCVGTLSAQAVGSLPGGFVYYLDRPVQLIEERKILESPDTALGGVSAGAGLLINEERIETLCGGEPMSLEPGDRPGGRLQGFVVRGIVNPEAPVKRDRVQVLQRE